MDEPQEILTLTFSKNLLSVVNYLYLNPFLTHVAILHPLKTQVNF